jgi:hypothetical protein
MYVCMYVVAIQHLGWWIYWSITWNQPTDRSTAGSPRAAPCTWLRAHPPRVLPAWLSPARPWSSYEPPPAHTSPWLSCLPLVGPRLSHHPWVTLSHFTMPHTRGPATEPPPVLHTQPFCKMADTISSGRKLLSSGKMADRISSNGKWLNTLARWLSSP